MPVPSSHTPSSTKSLEQPQVNRNVCTCTWHLIMAAGQVNVRPLHGLDHAVHSGNYVRLTHNVLVHIGVTIYGALQIQISPKKINVGQ